MSLPAAFTAEAEDQLVELHRYIAAAASIDVAARYVESIVAFCEELGRFPQRGKSREDSRPSLRTVGSSGDRHPASVDPQKQQVSLDRAPSEGR